jgi:hydrogenase nickel incorporation protein HypA/HybF
VHEHGIVQNLLSQVEENVRANAGRQAVRVWLSVGGMTAGEQHMLQEAFDTCKAGTLAHQAELVLHSAPTAAWCAECGAMTWLTAGQHQRCPACGSGTALPVHPQDIYLESVEIEV